MTVRHESEASTPYHIMTRLMTQPGTSHFHFTEHPTLACCSLGPLPVPMICFMASNNSSLAFDIANGKNVLGCFIDGLFITDVILTIALL